MIGDRDAGLVLLVLPRVAEIGHHGRDAGRGGAPERVDQDEELHHVVVHRRARRLDDEDVGAADVLVDLAVVLAVGEVVERQLPERNLEVVADLPGERRMRAPREDLEVTVRKIRNQAGGILYASKERRAFSDSARARSERLGEARQPGSAGRYSCTRLGRRQIGKAPAFGAGIWRFESSRPSQHVGRATLAASRGAEPPPSASVGRLLAPRVALTQPLLRARGEENSLSAAAPKTDEARGASRSDERAERRISR